MKEWKRVARIFSMTDVVNKYNDYKKQGNGHYGIIYFNKKTREIFINEYCDLSHFSYTHYNDENIVNLSTILEHRCLEVNISNMMELITEGDF